MGKKDFKRNRWKPVVITVMIIALIASFTYFVVIRRVNFNLGERYYISKSYPEAISKLKPLGNYRDSYSLYIRSLYKQGMQYYDMGNYLDAMKYFGELADELPGAEKLVTDCKYMTAISEGSAGRFGEAIIILNGLEDCDSDCQTALEAASSRDGEFFIHEYKTHNIPMEMADVVNLYLDKK